jgi:tryptophanyl-tRNA synthetase
MEAHTSLMDDYNKGALKYSDLKEAVAEGLVDLSAVFKERRADIQRRRKEIKNQIKASSATIRKRAQETLKEVKDLAGLSNVRY